MDGVHSVSSVSQQEAASMVTFPYKVLVTNVTINIARLLCRDFCTGIDGS